VPLAPRGGKRRRAHSAHAACAVRGRTARNRTSSNLPARRSNATARAGSHPTFRSASRPLSSTPDESRVQSASASRDPPTIARRSSGRRFRSRVAPAGVRASRRPRYRKPSRAVRSSADASTDSPASTSPTWFGSAAVVEHRLGNGQRFRRYENGKPHRHDGKRPHPTCGDHRTHSSNACRGRTERTRVFADSANVGEAGAA
jgi:hypothetical protein